MRWPSQVAVAFLTFGLVALATAEPRILLESVTSGLSSPLDLQNAGDGSGRLFVVEQSGRILIFDGTTLLATPFLDIRGRVLCCGERGLLGLTFHPNYPTNGLFYVNFTIENPDPIELPGVSPGDTVVASYRVSGANPNVADPSSEQIVLTFPQPFSNHNGGQLQFGPDGYLYIATGDGGSSGDPQNNGQRLDTLLGKILRIDVDGGAPYVVPADNPFVASAGARDEIWAYGLRNPWRMSFDRATGDLFIADVGQGAWEEVNFQPAGSAGGVNYGWRCREGAHDFNTSGCSGKTFVEPIAEYSHSLGCSISGGYRYRGYDFPELLGIYFYGDYCSGRIWGAYRDGSDWVTAQLLDSTLSISSFGEDERGEIYVVDISGDLFRIAGVQEDELAVDFGGGGLWHYDGSWNGLTSWDPGLITASQRSVAVTLGVDRGLWVNESGSWRNLTLWNPYAVASWRDSWLAAFDAGRGLWLRSPSGWQQLTTWEPESLLIWGDHVAVDFGEGRGLWLYDSENWVLLTPWSPERLVSHGPRLAAAFGGGRGLWLFGAEGWSQIATWDPYDLSSWAGKLVAAFDAGRGTFTYDGTSWRQLTILEPTVMTVFDGNLAASFGSGRGLFVHDGVRWRELTSWDPQRIEAVGSDLAADFGGGRGLWIFTASGGWQLISGSSAENIEAVDLF